MRSLSFFILTIGFYLSAHAEIAVKMTAPGSVPESQLYMLSGVENESAEKVAMHLATQLQKKNSSEKIQIVEKTDLKTALESTGLPITQLNKIEYFSNKNQSEIFKVKIKDHQYKIYLSASKDLALIVGS